MARYVKLAERKPVAEKGLLRRLSNRMNTALQPAKRLRNTLIDRRYSRRPSPDLAALLTDERVRSARNLTVSIAFNDTGTIDLLAEAWNRHVSDSLLIVADNSETEGACEEIRRICAKHGIPYLRLPANPTDHISRSHGHALNWVWRNVIGSLRPAIFGTIDHDCYPVAPFSVAGFVGDLACAGVARLDEAGHGNLFLWPVFSFFRLGAPEIARLDFLNARQDYMDTGGANWRLFLRDLPADRIRWLKRGLLKEHMAGGDEVSLEGIADIFIHLGYLTWTDRFDDPARRAAVNDHIRRRIRAGGS
ncbi:MAG: hypothetical protein AB7L41_02090 [Flavobacteriaceae bacterium]